MSLNIQALIFPNEFFPAPTAAFVKDSIKLFSLFSERMKSIFGLCQIAENSMSASARRRQSSFAKDRSLV
jgi:hypothetical protein